ncbi:hypothetical protein PR048_012668 [Dryococelus australis]|uniref:Uncharacterized protein n=1 Tax=Dryococelus australis TaxID=614101 RepID=A0ABQ9HQ01_9NEOP|nr:hypothetical protein PR048_012668 [Dryococelus australis]
MPDSFMESESYNAIFQLYILKGKGCEEMVCNKHYLNLLKGCRPILKSTKIQDVLSLMKSMKPKNAQWLQNLVDSIWMDGENNEDDVFSAGEEMGD